VNAARLAVLDMRQKILAGENWSEVVIEMELKKLADALAAVLARRDGTDTTRDFELQVTVRVYGPDRFSAQDAAVALRAGTGSIDMGDDAECEILAAVPLTPLR